MNYSPEITANMIARYTAAPNKETVTSLALELGRTEKSIIGKLAREGVYRRLVYTTKLGTRPVSKLEMVRELAIALEIDSEKLIGLDKTPKHVLQLMIDRLTQMGRQRA